MIKMNNFIPVYQPYIGIEEREYVNDCLESGWISSKGKYVQEFEFEFAKYIGAEYGVSVCNGTVALHVALLALGVGPGDEVIVPTFTYVASVNAIAYTGAKPVFVDSELKTWQMNAEEIEKKITPKTKAVLAVHLYGQPCDMDSVCRITKKYDLFLVEDCAEAIGTYFRDKHVGTFGDVSTFSFFGNKTITTGEGGFVVTNSVELVGIMQKLKGQGLSTNREYWHDVLGYNYRMTNICAAIGVAQLGKISKILELKKQCSNFYFEALKGLPIEFHNERDNAKHSYWMFSILTNSEYERNELRKFLAEKGVETRPTFNPVHLMPMYFNENIGLQFPVAVDLSKRGINLPSWPGLTNSDLLYICNSIKEYYLD